MENSLVLVGLKFLPFLGHLKVSPKRQEFSICEVLPEINLFSYPKSGKKKWNLGKKKVLVLSYQQYNSLQ